MTVDWAPAGLPTMTVPGDESDGATVLVKPLSPDDNSKVLVESGGAPTITEPEKVPEGEMVLVYGVAPGGRVDVRVS